MAVPNTTNFSFIDVKNEIENNGGTTTNSLVDAFNNATFGGFDPDYEGSKNSLLNFRNYEHIVNTILIDTITVYHGDHYDTYYFFKINSYGSTLNTITVQFSAELDNYDSEGTVSISSLNPEHHETVVLSNNNQSQIITFSIIGEYSGEISSNVNYNEAHEPTYSNFKGYEVTMTLISASVNGIPNPNSISFSEGTLK